MADGFTPDHPKVVEAVALVNEHGSVAAAARASGINRRTLSGRYNARNRQPPPDISLPEFPDDDVPVGDVIKQLCSRFEKRRASWDAHTWFTVDVREKKPIGVLWFGDPHLDDNGCNWPLLKRHADLCATVPGLYGANIGDTTNNWHGRLVRLYAEQDTSLKTAHKLAEWFMLESGIRWLVWIIGNHDAWGDGARILASMGRRYGTQKVVCHDWEARFNIRFPGGWAVPVYASHDFKGNSQWNPLHGPMKEGQMGEDAMLYVCGHKHNYAAFAWENAKRGTDQKFIRVRGYKEMDDYALRRGFPEQRIGAAVLTVLNPDRQTITVFDDIDDGVDFLRMKRGD